MRWYLNLNKSEVRRWRDLADAFLTHYQHNADLAPDKSALRILTPNKGEKFRAFAQRWRNVAAQIFPPLNEKELIDEFMALGFLDDKIKTTCALASTFTQLVTAGLRIETSQGNVFKTPEDMLKGKKKEIHNIGGENSFNQSIYRVPGQNNKPRQQYHHQQPNPNNQQYQQHRQQTYQATQTYQQQLNHQPQQSQAQNFRQSRIQNPLPIRNQNCSSSM